VWGISLRKARKIDVPDTLGKRDQKDLHLISIDKAFDKEIVNWDKVGIAFDRYAAQRDHASGLLLATRIAESKLPPPPKIAGSILRLLSDQDQRLVAPVVLRMFEDIVERRIYLSDSALDSLIWILRSTVDPFARTAYYELFQDYFEYAKKKQKHFLRVDISYMHSLLENGEFEEARTVFTRLVAALAAEKDANIQASALKVLPIENMFQTFVAKWDDVDFGCIIIDAMITLDIDIGSKYWSVLLEAGLKARNEEAINYVWRQAVQPGKFSPSIYSLKTIVDLFSDSLSSTAAEALQRLSLQDPTGPASKSDVANVFHLHLNAVQRSSPVTAELYFKGLQSLLDYLPSVELQDLAATHDILHKIIVTTPADQLVDTIISVNNENSDHASEQRFLTLAMNLVLYTTSAHSNASDCLNFYRSFINAEVKPSSSTFEFLALAAFRLKNAKKLSYIIFRECTGYGFTPTAITLMYLIRASLPGRELETTLFYVSQITGKPETVLPGYFVSHLRRTFEQAGDGRLMALLRAPEALRSTYQDFPSDRVLSRSVARGKDKYSYLYDVGNCHRFEHGWDANQLSAKE
jgi:hypothetical protein